MFKKTVSIAFATALMATSAFAADHAVSIKGFKFDAATINVAVGDTITFTNEDGAPHTATAKDGSFDTGRLSKGKSATITIEKAGTFEYFCEVHPSMTGKVVAK